MLYGGVRGMARVAADNERCVGMVKPSDTAIYTVSGKTRDRQYFWRNFDKFKYIVVVFLQGISRGWCETINTTKVRLI